MPPFFIMSKPKRSIEDCLSEAKKYSSRSEFFKGSQASYASLLRRDMLDSACAHMPLSPRYSYVRWDAATVLAEATKYSSRSEFKRNNAGAYEFALSNGLLPRACLHMGDGQKFWHVFELMAVALKYSDKTEFIRLEKKAYTYAKKSKLTEIAFAHMSSSRTNWDKASVIAEAAKHKKRGLFQASAAGAYKHADKYGYLDEACAHMEVRRHLLDKTTVMEIAKSFANRTDFQYKSKGGYLHAKRNGFLEEACAHMTAGANGFCGEKPATLYHLKLTLPCGGLLYKIGITNRTPEARIYGLGLHEGVHAEVIDVVPFDDGRDARIAEKRLHRRLAANRYQGPKVMKNGNTELFTVNILEFEIN